MKFKLDFQIPASSIRINIKEPIYLIGSCFSDDIGQKLIDNKFSACINPFGTIYNPHSIFKLIKGDVASHNTIKSQGVYYHWDAHGEISGLEQDEAIGLLEERLHQTIQFLAKANWLIITLGTAWVYRYKQNGAIVANCHKVPSSEFSKELLSIDTIVEEFETLKEHLAIAKPGLKILFTISPVRHVRDGLIENNQSKSILVESVRQIIQNHEDVSYFPSYEIMMDELRDYRFYTSDLIHPSPDAITYIWDRFCEAYLDDETLHLLKEWQSIKAALNHRAIHPDSPSHQHFLKETLHKLERLNDQIDLRVEIEAVKKQLL